jgi:hypothetical protein
MIREIFSACIWVSLGLFCGKLQEGKPCRDHQAEIRKLRDENTMLLKWNDWFANKLKEMETKK